MLLVLNDMMRAIFKAPSAYPFVVSPDAVAGSRKYCQLAGIVNLSILVSVALLGLGICIAAMVQSGEFLKYLRHRTSHTRRAASLIVQ
jgi:hypothetical protein